MKRLKELREHKGLTLRDLASILNISHSSIDKYERGLYLPNSGHLLAFARYFNVTTDFLLENERSNIVGSISPVYEDLDDCIQSLEHTLEKLKNLKKQSE